MVDPINLIINLLNLLKNIEKNMGKLLTSIISLKEHALLFSHVKNTSLLKGLCVENLCHLFYEK
jgi:hypothetical protein